MDDTDTVDEVALVANVATGGGYASSTTANRTVRVTVDDDEQTGTDYDADDDGLIEIGGHAQLNAVRWDLDGNGSSAEASRRTSKGCTAARQRPQRQSGDVHQGRWHGGLTRT